MVALKQSQHVPSHFTLLGLHARLEQIEQVVEGQRLVGGRQNVQQAQSERALLECVLGVNPLTVVTQVPGVLWVRQADVRNFANSRYVRHDAVLHYLVNDVVDVVGNAIYGGGNRVGGRF